jgi:6-phosphogluconolactonase
MNTMVSVTKFTNRHAASSSAAETLAAGLQEAMAAGGRGSLVLSGGTTPGDCYSLLAEKRLDWARVSLVPSDERWVPPSEPASNERLIRHRMTHGAAGAARILSMYREGLEPDDAPAAITADLEALGDRFSGVLLGMGTDGHFASLFPDFEGLRDALDPTGATRCVVVRTAASPFPRISLTLPAMMRSPWIALLFFGDAKLAVFEAALDGDSRYPVSALLQQTSTPVRVLWAP